MALSDGGDNEEDEELYGVDVCRLKLDFYSLSLPDIRDSVRPRLFFICAVVFPQCI